MIKLFNRYVLSPLFALYCVIIADPDHILTSKEKYKSWVVAFARIKKNLWFLNKFK
jgi:hypothetical protein